MTNKSLKRKHKEIDDSYRLFHNDSFTDGVTTLLKNECFEIISDDCRIPFGTRNEYKAKCKAFGILLNDKRLKIRPEFLNDSKIKQDLFILAEAISQFSTDEINFLEIKFRELFPVVEIFLVDFQIEHDSEHKGLQESDFWKINSKPAESGSSDS